MSATGFVSGNRDEKHTLVVVFLRGGADGLHLVPPLGDDGYHNTRKRIGLTERETIHLDGFFGLNPSMEALESLYADGRLLIVHAAGSEDSTRSHFEAQDLMERGGDAGGGWLGRYLRYKERPAEGALAAVALGKSLPESLRGAPGVTVLEDLSQFSLGKNAVSFIEPLRLLYSEESDGLGRAALGTLEAVQRIEDLREVEYQPAGGAKYPENEFGEGLLQIARLKKARLGLEAATIDLGGWDSHFAQGTVMNPLMRALSSGLAAFMTDLGDDQASTTVIVMTEFGRRVYENSAFGTDHGRASVMFVLGGGVEGGRVMADWTGIGEESLEGPGDLAVTTNYRNILAPILEKRGGVKDFSRVFPGSEIQPAMIYG